MNAISPDRLTIGVDTALKLAVGVLVPVVVWMNSSIGGLKDEVADLKSALDLVDYKLASIERVEDRLAQESDRITTMAKRYNSVATRVAIIESGAERRKAGD